MVEKNEQGRQARKYFINCERLAIEALTAQPVAQLNATHAGNSITLNLAPDSGMVSYLVIASSQLTTISTLTPEKTEEYLQQLIDNLDKLGYTVTKRSKAVTPSFNDCKTVIEQHGHTVLDNKQLATIKLCLMTLDKQITDATLQPPTVIPVAEKKP